MDEEDQKWAIFLSRWRERLGSGPLKVNAVLGSAEVAHEYGTGREVDPWDGDFITDERGRRPNNPQKLGRMLAGQVDRFHGEPPMVLRVVTDAHTHDRLYRVEEYQP